MVQQRRINCYTGVRARYQSLLRPMIPDLLYSGCHIFIIVSISLTLNVSVVQWTVGLLKNVLDESVFLNDSRFQSGSSPFASSGSQITSTYNEILRDICCQIDCFFVFEISVLSHYVFGFSVLDYVTYNVIYYVLSSFESPWFQFAESLV